MISEAAKDAFRHRLGLTNHRPDFTPRYIAKMRRLASERGESDPFAEPRAAAAVEPADPVTPPAPAKVPPAVPAKLTAADVEFERVRAAALARQADEDAAVALILGALAKTRA